MTHCMNEVDPFETIKSRLLSRFNEHFGTPATFLSVAPGRVNVIGEHVDYNGGWVLPAAIERSMIMAVSPRSDRRVSLMSANGQAPSEFSLDELSPDGSRDWGRYVRGVLAGLKNEGIELTGFNACVDSTIPIGGGLSSSAALESATGLAVLAMAGKEMDRFKLAKICQWAEHTYAGVPCGIMDQAAILNCKEGHLLYLDCENETFIQTPFEAPGWGLMIINTNVAHELASGEYALRRKACHDAAEILGVSSLRHVPFSDLDEVQENHNLTKEMLYCVRHNVTENERTARTVTALAKGDIPLAGQLLNASHASLRDDYRVSCKELDFVASSALGLEGVAGCRMTGGGFGGSCVALVKMDLAGQISEKLSVAYTEKFGFAPSIFLTKPAAGARVETL